MFYEKDIDNNALRFGDVLRGYIAITPNIKSPILRSSDLNEGYNIDISLPIFSVIISPCCSIAKDNIISLTPLIEVRNSFFNNPYFKEDLTRINRKMEPQLAFPPDKWDSLPPEAKQIHTQDAGKDGKIFTLLHIFIYEECDSFLKYPVNMKQEENIQINYYMIDFRNTYKLYYDKIKSKASLESKCLQLSLQARAELRDKISYYYGRAPKEDIILED